MDLNVPRDGCGSDVAAHALGALTGAEARRFEDHLRGCELCRSDLEALRAVVDALPEAADHLAPPSALKKRIMRVVEAEARERQRASRRPARRARVLTLRPMAAAAAVAVLLLAGAFVAITPPRDDRSQIVSGDCIRACATVEMRFDDESATLEIERMDQPPRGRVYQVWAQRFGEEPKPTDALFSVDTFGNASVGVPGNIDSDDQILVTAEPPGGSLVPSTAPYLTVRL